MALFSKTNADNTDLSLFHQHGHKLMIDHGMDDPLIPVHGTINYMKAVKDNIGLEKINACCRMYITPGDGHGSCRWHGPGLTESVGMKALIEWVEHGNAPNELYSTQVDMFGHTKKIKKTKSASFK